jgi:hypothetical protein
VLGGCLEGNKRVITCRLKQLVVDLVKLPGSRSDHKFSSPQAVAVLSAMSLHQSKTVITKLSRNASNF